NAQVLPRERTGDSARTGDCDVESDLGGGNGCDGHLGAAIDTIDVARSGTTSGEPGDQDGGSRAAGIKPESGRGVQDDGTHADVAAGSFVVGRPSQSRVSATSRVRGDGGPAGGRIHAAQREGGTIGAGQTQGAGG